jgi:hypothetical protein
MGANFATLNYSRGSRVRFRLANVSDPGHFWGQAEKPNRANISLLQSVDAIVRFTPPHQLPHQKHPEAVSEFSIAGETAIVTRAFGRDFHDPQHSSTA